MTRERAWGVEWIVAALAPWTISPHPNFRPGNSTGAAGLALVTEMRGERDYSAKDGEVEPGPNWHQLLIETARASLVQETQADSVGLLWAMADDTALPPGARAVAALYGSVALSELERPDQAADRIGHLVDDLTRDNPGGPGAFAPSQRLAVSALLQQRAMRLAEASKFDQAADVVGQTLHWLPSVASVGYESFSVSEGISWGPTLVQRDIVRSIKNHALALKSRVEHFDGQTWVRVVRGRRGWVEMRRSYRQMERDELVLRDAFESVFEATSGTRHFKRSSAERVGYQVLLLAELSGHYDLIADSREKLGRILLLKYGKDPTVPERVREALRLLRGAQATKALQSALVWVRGLGPTSALVEDARIISERALRAQWCTESDLLVLESASEFLNVRERESAIRAALTVLHTEHPGGGLSWSLEDKLWRTILHLIPTTSLHGYVAEIAARSLAGGNDLVQPLANTLARLVIAIEWSQVDAAISARWLNWRTSRPAETDNRPLVDAIDRALTDRAPGMPEERGLDQAAFLADNGLPAGVHESIVSAASDEIVAALAREADEARQGRMSLGGISASNVAAAFAIRFQADAVWAALVGFLLDPQIDAILKNLALDRMARQIDDVPVRVRDKIRSNFEQLEKTIRVDHSFFGGHRSEVFTEALRVGVAIGAVPKERALAIIMRLLASSAPDRVEAVRTIPFAISDGDATWGHVLLLQISRDSDPAVRAEAGRALVMSLQARSELHEMVYSRIQELLGSDGVRVPLGVLHALQRLAESNADLVMRLLPVVEDLATSGTNSVVRGASGVVIEIVTHDQE